MELRVFTEPQQGASYAAVLRIARTAEELGFDAFFRSDHYLAIEDPSGLRPVPDRRRHWPRHTGPAFTDAWTSLAGLARETSTIRLGTLVSPVTFRLPGPLAIQVAQVGQMSGGRVELGLGTGWYEPEHLAYGIPFPDRRFDLLEEQLAIVTGLWSARSAFSFEGTHYQVVNSPGLADAVGDRRPPLIVGGSGALRTPALAARYAAEFNLGFDSPSRLRPGFERVRAACEEYGRDPATLTLSTVLTTCVGQDDREVSARAATLGVDADALRDQGLAGSPAEVVDRLGEFAELGVSRVYLQLLDISDLTQLELIAGTVLPAVRSRARVSPSSVA